MGKTEAIQKKSDDARKFNFTEARIAALAIPKRGRAKYFDTDVTTLAVMVQPTGHRAYYWYRKVNGAPTHRTIGAHPEYTVKAARDAARKLDVKLARWRENDFEGANPFKQKKATVAPTFDALVEAYIAHHVKKTANRPAVAEVGVRWLVKKYFAAWKTRPIDKITVADVLTVKNACGEHRYQANRCVEFVRAIFNWSGRTNDGKVNFWHVENPAKDVSSHDERRRERFLQPEELLKFNEELKKESNDDFRDILTLLLATGARRGNVCAMRWPDISFERANWHVPWSKSGETYEVNLTPAALTVLERRWKSRKPEQEFVFPSFGKSGHVEDVKKRWIEFRKRAGIPDVRIHDIRRTTGSYMAIGGVSLQKIGAALGHKSLGSTEVYAKLHQQAIADAREAGEKKMAEMTAAAQKRIKATVKKPKRLPAPKTS